MREHLTPQQIAIVNGKAQGKTQAEIGHEVYPNQTPGAAAVSVSRQLRKANVQDELQAALAQRGITIDRAVAPIAEALEATRPATDTRHETPDYAVRLRAADMALKLLVPTHTSVELANANFMQVVTAQHQRYGIV